MNTPRCSIIIPVYNQLAFTRACLDSIAQYTKEIPHEVIVVNNGSSDGTREYLDELAKNRPELRILHFGENKGYSDGNNEGVYVALSDHVLFLNNDTIVTENWLPPLLEAVSLEGVGLVGPKLLYPETGRVNHAGYVYNQGVGGFYPIYHDAPSQHPGVNKRREFQALLGACILTHKKIFLEAGMFGTYGLEDIDLCLKIGALGYKILYIPQSVVFHHGSVTLKGCDSASIAPADAREFNRRWPNNQFRAGDEEFYREDGYKILRNCLDRMPLLEDLATPSYKLVQEAELLRQRGLMDDAIAALLQAIEIYPCNEDAHMDLISLYAESGDLAKASAGSQQYMTECPRSPEAHITAMRFSSFSGDGIEVQQLYERFLKLGTATVEQLDRAAELNGNR